MSPVEIVRDGDEALAYLVRGHWMPDKSEFLTPDHFGQRGQSHDPVLRGHHGVALLAVEVQRCVLPLSSSAVEEAASGCDRIRVTYLSAALDWARELK